MRRLFNQFELSIIIYSIISLWLLDAQYIVDGGQYSTCAVTAMGATYCWGANTNGQVGDGTTVSPRPSPVAATNITQDVVVISMGTQHTCYISSLFSLFCFGANGMGQCGDGTSQTPVLSPVSPQGMSDNVQTVAAGKTHTCAIKSGYVFCWGGNEFGQIGDDSIDTRLVPVLVMQDGIFTIAVGNYHTCGILVGGALSCWGYNGDGRLGIGIFSSPVKVPTAVSGLPPVLSVTAGAAHSCGLTINQKLYCWGNNDEGQLGDGTTSSSSSPVLIAGFATDLVTISAGAIHTNHCLGNDVRCSSPCYRCMAYMCSQDEWILVLLGV
jgi:alpha-tubulin suppressor-like RCC1 family protein